MHVLGLIPARGGSKGVPRKNIRLLAGKPLLQYTAEAALTAQSIERVVLSTDDYEIAEVGERCGLELPFIRPAELAGDDTPMHLVVLHALESLKALNGYRPEVVVLLQPTTPCRTAAHIDRAIEQLEHSGARSLVSIVPVPKHVHPDWQLTLDAQTHVHLHNGGSWLQIAPRRQALSTTYIRNGAIYAFNVEAFLVHGSLYPEPCAGFFMNSADSINIDTEEDFREAEKYFQPREAISI